ncbi:EAL domain-containing protein (putative c-di-GMP-specific phosphodiesterase class I) [Arthrobacter sp. CG_A4]|nr:EAL domain-containing protein (putative c-di-GMP-specific phosphodiesterase class I) [Arthrobacter sp. CG_A4]
MRIVAEGVEDKAALTELASYGCDSAQGFFLSRPVTADQFDTWLATRTAAVAAT